MRLADTLGLDPGDRASLFFAAFLKDAGCSSNAAAITRLFGTDDIEAKRRQATAGRSLLSLAAFTIRTIPQQDPLPERVRRIIAIGLRGRREQREIEQAPL